MPTPFLEETKKEFVARCIPQLINEGASQEESVAVCNMLWVENIEQFEVTLEDAPGLDKISLVDFPAIEHDFVAMSKQMVVKMADEERQIITGPVLIPDQLIYRSENGNQWYQYFKEETIRQIAEKYFKDKKTDSVNIQHDVPVDDVMIIESWFIVDPAIDKSRLLGFDLPKGTWMVTQKINNKQLWDEAIKPGMLRGFSVEGHFTLKQSRITDEWLLQDIIPYLDEVYKS